MARKKIEEVMTFGITVVENGYEVEARKHNPCFDMVTVERFVALDARAVVEHIYELLPDTLADQRAARGK